MNKCYYLCKIKVKISPLRFALVEMIHNYLNQYYALKRLKNLLDFNTVMSF
jgi:hypothetical protein